MKKNISLLQDFAKANQLDISGFDNALVETKKVIQSIKELYVVPPFSSDEDMVVYGSIARKECVEGSDIDWTLLVDGQANPRHNQLISEVRKKLKDAKFNDPGTSGVFGQVSFSHELIHNIGGQFDTNHNLTKRILLLLESSCITFGSNISDSGTAYSRIIKGILAQYIENDSGLNSNRSAIPRFLLNDFVRYWRTVRVDFAYKQIEQEGQKWALRNIKLRISRKMLFVKGLLMCLYHYGENQDKAALIDSLAQKVELTPFELLISLQNHFEIESTSIANLISCYNDFLSKIGDPETRDALSKMNMREVYKQQAFLNLRNYADGLQDALDDIFIKTRGILADLTIKYAIF